MPDNSAPNAAIYAEVIRNALRLYEALVAEAEKGSEFAIKSPDGVIAPYRVFVGGGGRSLKSS